MEAGGRAGIVCALPRAGAAPSPSPSLLRNATSPRGRVAACCTPSVIASRCHLPQGGRLWSSRELSRHLLYCYSTKCVRTALSGATRQRTGCALLIFISALSGLVKIRAQPQQLLPVSASGRGRRRCPKGEPGSALRKRRAQPPRAGARKPMPPPSVRPSNLPAHRGCDGRSKKFFGSFFQKGTKPRPPPQRSLTPCLPARG